jgi:hypothetical protein
MAPKDRISLSLLGVKAEAEGLKGIVALLLIALLIFITRLAGLM